ncbi:GNAT family N-acetyltransferase [Microdochium nivale]|nr:GNAT family N-acetyltransferase [Microdochium nivale]
MASTATLQPPPPRLGTLSILPATRADLERCTRIELAAMLATSPHTRRQHPGGITDALVAAGTASKLETFGMPEVKYVKGVVPVGDDAVAAATAEERKDEVGDERDMMVGYMRYYVWATDEAARMQPPYEGARSNKEKSAASGSGSGGGDGGSSSPKRAEKEESVLERIDARQRAVHFDLRRRHVAGKRAVYISCLMVDPAQHSRGYGRKLMEPALALARDLGLPVYLMAQEAVGFYQSLGFEVVETGVADLAGLEGVAGSEGVKAAGRSLASTGPRSCAWVRGRGDGCRLFLGTSCTLKG